jgi:predicted membrane protein
VDLDARIKAGVGRVTVDLPEDTGVRVETSKGIGKVSLSGLRQKGGYYVNDAYGKTDVELDIRVEAGIGAIELRAGEKGAVGVSI